MGGDGLRQAVKLVPAFEHRGDRRAESAPFTNPSGVVLGFEGESREGVTGQGVESCGPGPATLTFMMSDIPSGPCR